eukprot:TRINITY_DN54044_c0_g1_i1.p1 TRINITY_DN54044_c0_g1~~TRINITY_DN54044_c0_g1_i1.p1  ORF type:complete len:609 (-),score=122.26 TRINITY_DN54044_c0_g1_i1:67-1854(-)
MAFPVVEQPGLTRLRKAERCLDSHQLLVKSIKNQDWTEFLANLCSGDRFLTSMTLPPPGAQRMRLYGGKLGHFNCLSGLLWFLDELDLSDCHCWPTTFSAFTDKYYCRTTGHLPDFLRQAECTLDYLKEENRQIMAMDEIPDGGVKFNEVFGGVQGAKGIAGMICRSRKPGALLYAMGVRSTLRRLLPAVGDNLPLFFHQDSDGCTPVTRAEELEVLRQYLEIANKSDKSTMVDWRPLGSDAVEGLLDVEKALLHGVWGLDLDAVKALLSSNSRADAKGLLLLSLARAVELDNAYSVQLLARLCLTRSNEASPKEATPLAPSLQARLRQLNLETAADIIPQGSEEVLHALGARVAIEFYLCGNAEKVLESKIRELKQWLRIARISAAFRIESYIIQRDFNETEAKTDPKKFVGGGAIANREKFVEGLYKLRDADCLLDFFESLHELVESLHSPSLRLGVVCEIVGINPKYYDLEKVKGTLEQAVKVAKALAEESDIVHIPSSSSVDSFQCSRFQRHESPTTYQLNNQEPPPSRMRAHARRVLLPKWLLRKAATVAQLCNWFCTPKSRIDLSDDASPKKRRSPAQPALGHPGVGAS